LTYGTTIVAPEAPEKEGHTFDGWQDVPETVPASDVTIESSYTINTYIANYVVDDEVYQTFEVTYGEQIPGTTPPTKTGHTFTGWSEIPGTMPAHDVTITAIFSVNQYLVTFKIGDEVISSESLDYGTAIQAPEAPDKEGYTFNGWQDMPETVPANDVTIEGSYTINTYVLTYIVDDEVYQSFEVTYGDPIPTVDNPVKTGYTFNGWDVLLTTMPARDVTITAGWLINQYVVTFMDGETVLLSQSLDYNSPITPPADPEKEGHTFIGWTPAVDEYVPDHDVTYQAKYEVNYYSITYYINDEAIYQEYMAYGEKIVEYVPELEEGNTFYGWDTEIPKTMPAYNVHIYGTAQYPVSINGVLNESKQDIRVYNLQGKLIQIVKRQEEIKDLPTGIYIINGKKYIIP
jgi:uncharacterized repeat protein (TIGR02543 family)